MKLRGPMLISAAIVAFMLAVSFWGWMNLPADAPVAIHWGFDGKPNGFAPREFALLLLPAIALAMICLFSIIPVIEPRRANLEASRTLFVAGWLGGLLVLAGAHVISIGTALGVVKDGSQWIVGMVAVLIVVIGNYLGKSRSTFLVGLKLPWTLSSDFAWEKSSRFAGRALVATGLLSLVADAAFGVQTASIVLVAGSILGTVGAAIASYFYWLRDPSRLPDARP